MSEKDIWDDEDKKKKEEVWNDDDNNNEQDYSNLASRWARLGAVIIDTLILMAIILPCLIFSGYFAYQMEHPEAQYALMALSTLIGFIVFTILHGYFLKKSGQTIGKKMLGIKIVDMNGNQLSLSALIFKRYFPINLINAIPVIGGILALINLLFIFSKSKRCVHDRIAGTQVIKV